MFQKKNATPADQTRHVKFDQWLKEGESHFGGDRMNWRFVCPLCGRTFKASDWRDAGAKPDAVGFACVGRWKPDLECDYAGGGLFRLNPVRVETPSGKVVEMFEFAK
jgi:hypothetical protein